MCAKPGFEMIILEAHLQIYACVSMKSVESNFQLPLDKIKTFHHNNLFKWYRIKHIIFLQYLNPCKITC